MVKTFNKEENKQLLIRYKNGDYSAREELIVNNLNLVHHILKRIKGVNINKEDMFQEGIVGLIKEIDTFDDGRNVNFSDYAGIIIERTMLMSIHKRSVVFLKDKVLKYSENIYKMTGIWPSPEEISKDLGLSITQVNSILNSIYDVVSLHEVTENNGELLLLDLISSNCNVEQQVLDKVYVEKAFSILTQKEQQVLKCKYGFDDGIEKTLEQVGQKLGYTKEGVRLIENRALNRIRNSAETKIKSTPNHITK